MYITHARIYSIHACINACIDAYVCAFLLTTCEQLHTHRCLHTYTRNQDKLVYAAPVFHCHIQTTQTFSDSKQQNFILWLSNSFGAKLAVLLWVSPEIIHAVQSSGTEWPKAGLFPCMEVMVAASQVSPCTWSLPRDTGLKGGLKAAQGLSKRPLLTALSVTPRSLPPSVYWSKLVRRSGRLGGSVG